MQVFSEHKFAISTVSLSFGSSWIKLLMMSSLLKLTFVQSKAQCFSADMISFVGSTDFPLKSLWTSSRFHSCYPTGGKRPAVSGVRGAAEGGHAALPDDLE